MTVPTTDAALRDRGRKGGAIGIRIELSEELVNAARTSRSAGLFTQLWAAENGVPVEVAALNGRTYAHSEARSDNYTPPTPEEAELTYAYRELPINSPEPAEDNRPSRRRENDVMRLMGDGATDDAPEPGDEDDREENAVEHDDEDLDRDADGPAEDAARERRRSPRRAATTPPTSPRSWTRPARTPRAARRAPSGAGK